MAGEADDLRYQAAEVLGRAVAVTGSAGAAVLSVELTPGRYALRVLDFDGATSIFFRQGGPDVVAAAAAPSTGFLAPTDPGFQFVPLFHFIVRGVSPARTPAGAASRASADNFISVFQVAGTTADIQVTKVSRGKA